MLDGILFEKEGVPAVSIVTDPFIETGQEMVRIWGVPHYKFLSTPHPIANLTEEELDQRARDMVPKVTHFLMSGKV